MNKLEVGKLLTIAAGFDQRKVDQITTEAWFLVPEIQSGDFEAAKAVVIAHQTGPKAHEYLSVRHVVDGLRVRARNTVGDIEADVRSAKARGLVSQDHPRREPLPEDAARRLFEARERERIAAAERLAVTDGGSPADIGNVGQGVPS